MKRPVESPERPAPAFVRRRGADRGSPVVAITGASSGIGAATARRFAASGASLVIGARNEPALDSVASSLRERFGAPVEALRCDVRCESDVEEFVARAVTCFGRIDVLVNNAGQGFYGRVEETPPDHFRDLIETNLIGVHHGIRAAVPRMRAQGSGHLVVVGSVVGKRSWPYHGAYAATKFALVGLVQALQAELAGSGVTATLVLPANVRTRFFDSAPALSGYVPRPLGPSQPADAVARAIVRSAEHPSPEVNTVRAMRIASVIAEAFPSLAASAATRFYRRYRSPEDAATHSE